MDVEEVERHLRIQLDKRGAGQMNEIGMSLFYFSLLLFSSFLSFCLPPSLSEFIPMTDLRFYGVLIDSRYFNSAPAPFRGEREQENGKWTWKCIGYVKIFLGLSFFFSVLSFLFLILLLFFWPTLLTCLLFHFFSYLLFYFISRKKLILIPILSGSSSSSSP